MRSLICAVAVVCFSVFAASAHADTTYDFTLIYSSGSLGSTLGGGSGSFSINTAPTGALSDYISTNTTGDILDSLSFTIDGQTFDLGDTTSTGTVEFREESGVQVVDDISYNGSLGSGSLRLTLASGDLNYYLYNGGDALIAQGTIGDIALAPAATPEPSSLALLGTGLLGACAVLRRRRLV